MELLKKTVLQVGVILVAANLVLLATETFGWGMSGWKVADIMLIALGVFSLRLYQEITFAAFRASKEPTDREAAEPEVS